MADLREGYHADRHPDVLRNDRTADQVLIEFLETFEVHHNVYEARRSDGNVAQDEFVHYYRTISWCTDQDDYFNLGVKSVWGLRGDANPY